MQTFEPAPEQIPLENPNGAFLAGIEAQACSYSPLAESVTAVTQQYIHDGELGFALALMQNQKIRVLSDYWDNRALDALVNKGEATGFDDTTSNRMARTIGMYLRDKYVYEDNQRNADPCFDDLRPLGFEIENNQQPVMAIVALDPAQLGSMSETDRYALLDEVVALRKAVMTDGEVDREMSPKLTGVLSACSLTKDAMVSVHAEDGTPVAWRLPFDKIASLKALYMLLSGEDTSGAMRQGAVRMVGENGHEIIVGCSGLNSAIDEMVAANFANDVLATQAYELNTYAMQEKQ